MSLFIDRHNMYDYTPEQLAHDHLRDLEVQDKYGVNFFSYFFDYPSESVCCLVEAADQEAVLAAHRETCGEGDMPTQIIEVTRQGIEAFLGPMRMPQPGEAWDEIAFRTILWVDADDLGAVTRRLGDARAAEITREVAGLVQQIIADFGGRVVSGAHGRVLASFRSAARALESATTIQRRVTGLNARRPDVALPVRIGVNAGEPVTSHDDLFGAAVDLAEATCERAVADQIVVTAAVRDICLGKQFEFRPIEPIQQPDLTEPVRLYELAWTQETSPASGITTSPVDPPDGLSQRELEVLRLIAAGRSNQQLADDLVISLNTVRRHVSNIYTKIGACNRAEATAYAHRNGLV